MVGSHQVWWWYHKQTSYHSTPLSVWPSAGMGNAGMTAAVAAVVDVTLPVVVPPAVVALPPAVELAQALVVVGLPADPYQCIGWFAQRLSWRRSC